MSNKMWGGRFSERPDAIMEEINVSIDVDRHLYSQDIAASKAHAAMLAAQGIITANDAKNIGKGLDTILSEIGKGSFDFKRALEDIHMNVESRLSRIDRACRGTAAHRALAQRPGRDRFPPLCPRHHRRDRCGAGRVPAGAGGAGAGTCRHRDAGLHPSADRAARDVRASFARLCRDGRARPRPLCRCAQAAERIAARRRGARRHLVSDRPDATAKALGFDRPMANSLDAVSDRDFVLETLSAAVDRGHAPVALRRGDRDLDLAAGRLRAAVATSSPPAPRSCRRSAIPMPPNWCAPRPAG